MWPKRNPKHEFILQDGTKVLLSEKDIFRIGICCDLDSKKKPSVETFYDVDWREIKRLLKTLDGELVYVVQDM